MYLRKVKRVGLIEKYYDFIPTVLLSLFLVIVVALLTRLGSVIPKKEYIIYYEDEKIADISTCKKNVRDIAEEVLFKEKKEKLNATDLVLEGKQDGDSFLEIKKGFNLKIDFLGQEKEFVAIEGESISELLEREGIELEENVFVEPVLETVINKDLKIRIKKVELKQEDVKEEPLPFSVKEEPSTKINEGEKKVVQNGVNGTKKTYKQNTYENGKLVSQEQKEEIITPAKDEIVLVGKKSNVVAQAEKNKKLEQQDKKNKLKGKEKNAKNAKVANCAPAAPPANGKRVLVGAATAYPATAYRPGGRLGKLAKSERIIAVNPKVIPLGTRVHIEGVGDAIAADVCEAAVKGIRGVMIDICMPTRAACGAWGKRNVRILY